MKSLFDSNFRYTEDGMKLNAEIGDFLSSKMDEYVSLGYSPREIGHIATGSVMEAELEMVLSKPVVPCGNPSEGK